MKYILIIAALFCSLPQIFAQNNITYGAGISYTNGAPSFTPPARTSRVAIDTITGKWYHYNTPGGWQLLGNTIEEIAGCSAPAYTPTKGDSKVVINNCTAPELYYWTGSAWVWINEGTTYYAGEGIRIQNDSIILDSLYYLQFRTGSNTDLDAGRLSWNAQEGTLDVVINSGNVTGQVFEDVFFNCKNQTGSTITRGTVVMAVGTLGASGRILIAPAIADGSVNSEYILGTAAQDIANGADGLVYHFGKDRGLNTTGASCGETWADRDVLYCSATTAGCLTKTVPTAPNLKVPIAIVINAANNGTLFVRPSHFPDLNQINDVQLTSPTTGQTLIYNSVTGVWSNQTPSDPSATNELQTLSVATNTATLSNGGGSVTIAGAGINTVGTTGTTITVTGTEVDGSVSNELQTLSTGTNTLTLSNGGGTVTVDTDPASDVTGSGANGRVSFWTGTQTQTGDGDFIWDNTNKRLGVGASVANTGTFNVRGATTSTSAWTAQFHNSGGASNSLMIRDDGNVGIGTNTLQAKLHVTGNVYVPTGFRYMGGGNASNAGMSFWGTQDGNTGWGGFMGRNMYYDGTNYYYSSTNAAALWGTVAGLWVQGNSFNTIALGLIARPPTEEGLNVISTNTDRLAYMRLAVTYSGNIGINNTNPSARLHVVGSGSTSSTWTAQFHNSAGNNNALMIRDDGNIGVRTNAPTDLIDINGANGYSQLRLRTAYTPTGTADANGNTGDLSWDDNYIYIKTAAGWKRSALSTF